MWPMRVILCGTQNVFRNFQKIHDEVFMWRRLFLRRFRDPIRLPRIENWVPRIRWNGFLLPRIRENRVLRIREIGSLPVHTGYLTFSLKKTDVTMSVTQTSIALSLLMTGYGWNYYIDFHYSFINGLNNVCIALCSQYVIKKLCS